MISGRIQKKPILTLGRSEKPAGRERETLHILFSFDIFSIQQIVQCWWFTH